MVYLLGILLGGLLLYYSPAIIHFIIGNKAAKDINKMIDDDPELRKTRDEFVFLQREVFVGHTLLGLTRDSWVIVDYMNTNGGKDYRHFRNWYIENENDFKEDLKKLRVLEKRREKDSRKNPTMIHEDTDAQLEKDGINPREASMEQIKQASQKLWESGNDFESLYKEYKEEIKANGSHDFMYKQYNDENPK